jgi:dTDP-4-dehydrorhamnose reductase
MRCLVLGGDGMLGHQLLQSWSARHEVFVTLRGQLASSGEFGLFTEQNTIDSVDVRDERRLREVLETVRPQAVVNAVGVVKQRPSAKQSSLVMEVNALFPHRLCSLCEVFGARMVHISTDCVFNGKRGMYTEQDTPNALDLYGTSKALGEVTAAGCVTIRSSIIGLELKNKQSLIEWFLAQQGTIQGFSGALYSGLTTLEMARVIESVLLDHPGLTGIWHATSAPISKFDLLTKLAAHMGRTDIRIEPNSEFCCDRSLSGEAFTGITGYRAPDWDSMLAELAEQIKTRGTYNAAA